MGVINTFTFTSNTETVTRTKLNNLVANLLSEFNGNIENVNIKAGAAIAYSKLDLTGAVLLADLAFNAGTSATASFDNGDLTAGVYTFNHAIGIQYLNIIVYDNNDIQIEPDLITATDTNNAAIDISSFGTITSTWNIRGIG